MKRATPETFWAKVDRSGGPDACWPWTGIRNADGYGRVGYQGRRIQRAHRVAWMLSYGAVGLGLCVLHKCDFRACCNPRHLFVGSHSNNMSDMAAKRRSPRGEQNRSARLTAAQIVDARARARAGESNRSIAKALDVGSTTIWNLLHGRTWSHVQGAQQ